jgi:hypothetical protein
MFESLKDCNGCPALFYFLLYDDDIYYYSSSLVLGNIESERLITSKPNPIKSGTSHIGCKIARRQRRDGRDNGRAVARRVMELSGISCRVRQSIERN